MITVDKERIALLHMHIPKGLNRVAFFKDEGCITEHIHTSMKQFDRANQQLHIRTGFLVSLCLVCMKKVDTCLLSLLRRGGTVLRTQCTNHEQREHNKNHLAKSRPFAREDRLSIHLV